VQATLSHYRILEQIGAGGMGVVYRAHDEHLDCDVALKVLPPGKLSDEAARKRFRKEALALSKLNHPNIAVVHDFDTQDGTDFLVEELIPGLSLSEMLISGPLPEREIINLGSQLADGLQAAHQQGVIHRDLKPANIRVTSDARLKILDFGLARIVQPSSPTALTASETQTPSLAGTLPYMAPEQLLAEKVDFRTDIWAVGCVLYEMATGRCPFPGSGPALIDAILHQPAPAASKLNSRLSPGLEAIILKCLEKDPLLRYASARDIAVDLQRLKRDTESAAQPGAAGTGTTRRLGIPWKVTIPLVVAVAVLAVGGYFYIHRPPKLTDKDTIVLADFDNKTGDAVFDDTLKQALAVHLEQSPFLNVLSDEKVNATLQLMGRQAGERLTVGIARDLCQRESSKALLAGSIASLGSQYVVGLQAISCSTGDTLVKEQTQAAGKEQVLKAVGDTANVLRRKLGESLVSVQKYDTPLEQATTSSLEALKAYSAGWKAQTQSDIAAIPFYKRAIELDPNFALAYSQLAILYSNTGQTARASEGAQKAFELRDRVSEHEKYRISAYYYLLVTGEMQKSKEAYELWKQAYPRDLIPYIDLTALDMDVGQWEKALPEAQQALRLAPEDFVSWGNLATIYLALNRLEEAKATLGQAQARKFDVYFLHVERYYAAFLSNDYQGMKEQASWAGGGEDVVLSAQSDTEAYFGRLAKAREFSQRAIDSARAADAKETAAFWQANAALHEAEFEKASSARQRAQAALVMAPGTVVRPLAALAMARAGYSDQARKLAEALSREFPQNTILQNYWLPAIWAAIELSRNNPQKARRSRHPHPEAGQGGVREAAVKSSRKALCACRG
jgi:Flp pilus assembly protein TadD